MSAGDEGDFAGEVVACDDVSGGEGLFHKAKFAGGRVAGVSVLG
jgi:hypothetical protein